MISVGVIEDLRRTIVTYSYMQICGSIAEQLTEELTYSYGQVLDIEVIELGDYDELEDSDHFAVGFAAVSNPKEEHPVEAVVCLLKRYPDHSMSECLMEDFHETAGPAACFCPERILDRLSPTRDVVALHWRKQCRMQMGWVNERWAVEMLEDLTW